QRRGRARAAAAGDAPLRARGGAMSAEGGPPEKRSGPAPRPASARNLAGVRLTPYGRTLDADAGELRLLAGERVVIDDRRAGTRVAMVVTASGRRPGRGPALRVLRRAEARDLGHMAEEEARHAEALAFARE